MSSSYALSLRRKPNAKYRRGPYRRRYAGGIPRYPRAKAIMVQGGAQGAVGRMTVGIPLPAEVKFLDQDVILPVAGTGDWQYLQDSALGSIICNATTNGRIGRQIKLVGIVYRFQVVAYNNSVPTPNGAASPFTIDFICDKQCNGAVANIAVTSLPTSNAVYSGTRQYELPNVQGQDRFTFLRRIQVLNPLSAQHNIVGSIACNHLITYDTDSTSAPPLPVADLATKNILVTYSSLGVTNAISGTVRYYYVDA